MKRLTTAPVIHVANVPAIIDLIPSETISVLRSGTRLPRPPIIIPRLPKLAKLVKAYVMILPERSEGRIRGLKGK